MQPSEKQMLAIFAHELREPLASILFAVQSVEEVSCAERCCRELRALVERQGQYLAKLISDALEIHDETSGDIRLHKEWFDINVIIAGAVEVAHPLLSQHRHRLSVSLPSARSTFSPTRSVFSKSWSTSW